MGKILNAKFAIIPTFWTLRSKIVPYVPYNSAKLAFQ